MYQINLVGIVAQVDVKNAAYKLVTTIESKDKVIEIPSIVHQPTWYDWMPGVGDLMLIKGCSAFIYEKEKFKIVTKEDMIIVGMHIQAEYALIMANSFQGQALGNISMFGSGNIGKADGLRFLPDGTAVTNFSVATTRRGVPEKTGEGETLREETPLWTRLSIWGALAESVDPYLNKGTFVVFEATPKFDEFGSLRHYETDAKEVRSSFEATVNKIHISSGNGGRREATTETELVF